MSIHNLHTTKLQFKFSKVDYSGAENTRDNLVPEPKFRENLETDVNNLTQIPKNAETSQNLISKGKAAILAGIIGAGGAAVLMEKFRVQPIQDAATNHESLDKVTKFHDLKTDVNKALSQVEGLKNADFEAKFRIMDDGKVVYQLIPKNETTNVEGNLTTMQHILKGYNVGALGNSLFISISDNSKFLK
jgi:flagellar hook-basal body complex protein FliE